MLEQNNKKLDYKRLFLIVSSILSLIIVCSFMLVSLTGCNSNKDNPNDDEKEETIVFEIDKTEYSVAEDTIFKIEVKSSSNANITWKSNNNSVADVSDGTVRAKQVGSCVVTATCKDKSIDCNIVVKKGENIITLLESDSYALKLNDNIGVKPNFSVFNVDENGNKTKIENAEISYSISGKIVKINGDGNLVASTTSICGTVQIKAEYNGEIAYADVTVYKGFISTTSEWNAVLSSSSLGEFYLLTEDLDFAHTDYSVCKNTSKKFRATIHGNGHTVKNITLDSNSAEQISLFGYVQNGKVSDIEFDNVCFSGTGSAYGLAITTESGASFSNMSLDFTYDSTLSNKYVIVGNCMGTFTNIMAIVNSANVISVFNYNNCTCENVYVFANNGVNETNGVNVYSTFGDFVWDINSNKPFDISCWNYLGGISLPILIKK